MPPINDEILILLKSVNDLVHIINAKLGIIMAESPEIAAFRARVEVSLIAIQKALASIPALNPEDKAVLEKLATELENLAGTVPQ